MSRPEAKSAPEPASTRAGQPAAAPAGSALAADAPGDADIHEQILLDIAQYAQPWMMGPDQPFRAVLEALPAALYITDEGGRIFFFNEAAATLWGRRPALGTSTWCGSWRLSRPDGQPMRHDECPMAQSIKSGRAVEGEGIAERPDGTRVPFCAYPRLLHDAGGSLVGAVSLLVDITERKQHEEQRELVARETAHRLKNLYATIEATINLTQADSIEAFRDAITGRIRAMAHADQLLADATAAHAVSLRQLADRELASYAQDNGASVTMPASDLLLLPEAAQRVAMIVHELATNAAKYGALSRTEGRVHVEWTVDDQGCLHLHWRESGGPAVTAPTRRGFGTRLIDNLASGLHGEAKLRWLESGLACEVVAPGCLA